ncbi:unnamed protein product [Porites evermanni]|uniref:Glycosyl transferase family 1 domain-containing protein n=1 Tax=Porites evermanni TaxID=104178 RepID=A0ABN8ML34_9CNID|nr:unnamed protein product [Porites evermanni]
MFKNYSDPISKGEEKHKTEVELCEMADHVVGVGPKLSEAFRSYLRSCQKDDNVVDFTPGVFVEFAAVKQALSERQQRSVLVFGRGDVEDFELKGFDIAGKAVAELEDTRLVFVGAPDGKHEEIAKRLTEFGVPPSRLRVRGFVQDRESLRRLFQEVDLVVMPSRTEGFGLTGLEALSAGLPLLVSRNSGFGEALCSVPFGSTYVVNSEEPADWTSAIKAIWVKDRRSRLEEAETLRESYGKKYNWAKQIKDLTDKMISWVNGKIINFLFYEKKFLMHCRRNTGSSSSVSKSTRGKTNYSRLCRLLISVGSRVLRDTFDSIIPPENLRELLKRDPAHSRLQLLRKKGVLTSVHWSRLYPATPTEIRDTLVRLGGADYEDLIDEMKDQDIEFLDEEHFRELLKQWKKVEDDIRDKLNEVESEEASKEKGLGLPYPTDVIEKIRQLYKTRERRLLPVPWLDEFSFHLNDIFTRLKILGKEKTQGVLTDDITNMTAIFKAHKECQRPRTVLIEGDPGMGKTTYCQKLAYD